MRLEAARGRVRTPTVAEGEPDELDRLDVPTLMTAFTAGSAFVNGRAGTTGRVAPGFLADLVVLAGTRSRGPRRWPRPASTQTWFDGACVQPSVHTT